MGSYLEINDTLQITTEQGFPSDILNRDKHLENPIKLSDVQGKIFEFHAKKNARIFHLDPVRVYLVHNINDKWLFWGRIYIQSQTISKVLDGEGKWSNQEWQTSGTFVIVDLYDPEYQKTFTTREAIEGKSFFD